MRNIMFVLFLALTANVCAPVIHADMQSVLDKPAKAKIQQEIMKQKALSEPFSVELFYNVLQMHVQHPDIVMRQAILETGWFTSDSFTEGFNLFGMKTPIQRVTEATGTLYGHAQYSHWFYAVMDLAKWQKYYNVLELSEKEYYYFLDTLPYATAKKYIKTLKSINLKT